MKLRISKKSILFKLLTITVYKTKDKDRAAKSKFEYLLIGDAYHLRLLGILHTLIGLTLSIKDGDD